MQNSRAWWSLTLCNCTQTSLKHNLYITHNKIYLISCCSLTGVVGCGICRSPWSVQKSDDELNALRLCPGRDHHINIVLMQRTVCRMLIAYSHSHAVSLLFSYCLLLYKEKERRTSTMLLNLCYLSNSVVFHLSLLWLYDLLWKVFQGWNTPWPTSHSLMLTLVRLSVFLHFAPKRTQLTFRGTTHRHLSNSMDSGSHFKAAQFSGQMAENSFSYEGRRNCEAGMNKDVGMCKHDH